MTKRHNHPVGQQNQDVQSPTRREALQTVVVSGLALYFGCDDEQMINHEGGMMAEEGGGDPQTPVYPEAPWGDVPNSDHISDRFAFGIASGDPQADSVVLWTCLTELQDQMQDHLLTYRVSTRPDLGDVVAEGSVMARLERNFCVKVTINDLLSSTRYYYGFSYDGAYSHIGRTRTLASSEEAQEDATTTIAVVSCASYNSGYFHVYRAVAEDEDVQVVLHLGDYIYESSRYARETVRNYSDEEEAKTLEGYRSRYADHRRDLDLQALHRAHPMIAIWDDHEFANNACPTIGGEEEGEVWTQRRQAATQAYYEWLPISEAREERLYQKFQLSPYVDLWMLDTRMDGRSPPLGEDQNPRIERFNENRTLISLEQERWLSEGLQASSAPWKLIGQQVMMGQLQLRGALESERENTLLLNPDQWDGFAIQRARLLTMIQEQALGGIVVLTGDIHTSWASELSINPSDPSLYHPEKDEIGTAADQTNLPHGGAIALECVTPSVTSVALSGTNETVDELISTANPHIKWRNLVRRGYLKLILSAEELRAEWWHMDNVLIADYQPPQLAAVTRATPDQPRWEIIRS